MEDLTIGVIGWFVAKILRDLVTNRLSVTGLDDLGRRAGLRETVSLSKVIGLVVYIFVLVPALIAALDALKIEAISAPATASILSPSRSMKTTDVTEAHFAMRPGIRVACHLL